MSSEHREDIRRLGEIVHSIRDLLRDGQCVEPQWLEDDLGEMIGLLTKLGAIEP